MDKFERGEQLRRREQGAVDKLKSAIQECHNALNNFLNDFDPQFIERKHEEFETLYFAYCEVDATGFLVSGCDPFKTGPVEHAGFIASSYSKLLLKISGAVLSSVWEKTDMKFLFQELEPQGFEHELNRVKKLSCRTVFDTGKVASRLKNLDELNAIVERLCEIDFEVETGFERSETKVDASNEIIERIRMVEGGIQIDDRVTALKPKQLEILAILVSEAGEYVSGNSHDFRSRDIEALPPEVRDIVDAQPGKGTRIYPEWFN